MNIRRTTAGILAAATVFTVSSSISDSRFSPFPQTAITAEAAGWTVIDNTHIAVDGIVYALNRSAKTATVCGFYNGALKKNLKLGGIINAENTDFRITGIEEEAFRGTKVENLDLSSAYNLKTISSYAFFSCEKLTTVKLGSSITSIGAHSFRGCTGLSSFSFGGNNKITSLPDRMFYADKALTSIDIPYSVKTIGEECFKSSGLTTVEISNNCTRIKTDAFRNCKKLTSVTFEAGGSTKLYIGQNAFTNCTRINKVNFDRTNYDAETNVFDSCGTCFKAYGYGAKDYVRSVISKLLDEWNISYNANSSKNEQIAFYNALMTKLHNYIKPASLDEQLQEGNAATVISLRKGTCGGYSRLFYNFCIIAGVSPNNVLVAGDCHCHAWNYVKAGTEWYNIDATNNVKVCDKQAYHNWFGKPAILGNGKDAHLPENWYVLVDDTIGTTDSKLYLQSFTLLFDDLIAHHREGSVYITGTRK